MEKQHRKYILCERVGYCFDLTKIFLTLSFSISAMFRMNNIAAPKWVKLDSHCIWRITKSLKHNTVFAFECRFFFIWRIFEIPFLFCHSIDCVKPPDKGQVGTSHQVFQAIKKEYFEMEKFFGIYRSPEVYTDKYINKRKYKFWLRKCHHRFQVRPLRPSMKIVLCY